MSLNPSHDMATPPKGTRECPICASSTAKSQFALISEKHKCTTKEGHVHKDQDRACKECWEAWISMEIERQPWDNVRCMLCLMALDPGEFDKLGVRIDTRHRYWQKKSDGLKFKCQARCEGEYTKLQPFNRETDGRVFTCNDCGFQTCYDCDRPEHVNETCEEFQARKQMHRQAEEKTYEEYQSCPNCEIIIDIEKGCGYVQCAAGNEMSEVGIVGGCGHRFCSRCLVNWAGENSAYLGGRAAHGHDADGDPCHYRLRDSAHGLKHRFKTYEIDPDEPVEKKAPKKRKSGTAQKQVVKKRKTSSKPKEAAKQ